ncbi:MAG: glycosyltransferase [Planctomycetota bacterium]|jgi:glycosyltransferase involved in cell wall biosynthesis
MSADRPLSVSVVIPAKNGRPTIGPCLDAVLAQDYAGDVDVLVIDSGSTDGSLDDIAARPSVRLHSIPPVGFDHGDTRNLGAGMTRGEAIVFLVQDAEPVGTRWLHDLVRNLGDPQVAGAFSRILPRPDAGPLVKKGCEGDLCFRDQRFEVSMHSREAWAAQDPTSLRIQCNFNDVSSVLRRSVWERLPFARGMFGEDIKFARAAIEAGWTIVFDPESAVLHSHEYDARTVYGRTYVDAVMNMRHLRRPCIDKFSHALIQTGRSWRADRAFLRDQGLPLGPRLKWGALSPLYHFAEFYGFWRGGRAAAAEGGHPPAAVPVPERPLKILFGVHAFPPDSWAGVEVLTLTLARALRARGHDVALFVRSPGQDDESDRTLTRTEFDGFRIHRFVNRLAFSGVDETYRFAPAEEAFDRTLEVEQPDVVHLQHMIHLSTGLIDRCRVKGVPCVVTLSDFWARCPRVQLIRPDRTNCLIPPPGLGCTACVKEKPRWIDPLARLDRLAGPLPRLWAAGVRQTVPAHPPGWKKSREDAASLVRREHWMRAVLQRADSLVVPSVTLKHALTELGLPPGRIALSEYGLDTSWCREGPPERVPRAVGEPLRVGFLGSLVWYKGLDVAARAVAALPPGSVHLHVHGDHEGGADPVAAAECRAVAAEARAIAQGRISFHGRYHHDDLAAIHARLDVLVVPSVWQEAYGLTVREAFLSRTPVVGSDIAGIAEGVRHEVNGLLFETGNSEALRAALQRFLDDPGLGDRLAAAAPAVRTDAMEAEEMEWRYRQVVSARGAGQGP